MRQFQRQASDTGFEVQVLIFSHTRRHMGLIEEETEIEVREDRTTW